MRFFFIPVQIISLLAEYGIFVGNICLYEARKNSTDDEFEPDRINRIV